MYKVVFREPAFKNPCVLSMKQARRLVVESGPAEISGECRRHEKGESTGGGFPPLVSGWFGGFPPRKFLNYRRLYVRFIAFWKHLGARISVILAKNLVSLT